MNAPIPSFLTDHAEPIDAEPFVVPPRVSRQARRKAKVAAIAAAVTGGAVLAMPIGLVEVAVASVGLSEILPAAAPPLGLDARLMLASAASVLVAGIGLALAGKDEAKINDVSIAMPSEELSVAPPTAGRDAGGLNKMGFAFSKLAAFARGDGRLNGRNGGGVLSRRRADSHPDAPPRRPIFASEDFAGTDFMAGPIAPVAETPAAPKQPEVQPEIAARPRIAPEPSRELPMTPPPIKETPSSPADFDPWLPRAPRPLEIGEIEQMVGAKPVPADQVPVQQAPVVDRRLNVPPTPPLPIHSRPAPQIAPAPEREPAPLPKAPVEGLSLTALTERFEQGLQQRARAEGPVAPAAAPSPLATEEAALDRAATTLAEIPPAAPVPVRPAVDSAVDQALREALELLKGRTPGR